jgi:hypothetical protein
MPQVVEVPGMGDVEFPDDMSDDQIAAAIQKNLPTQAAKPAAKNPFLASFRGPYDYNKPEVQRALGNDGSSMRPIAGAGETALHIGTGIGASAIAGLAGIGQGAWNKVTPESMNGPDAADRVHQVQKAMTYKPRTFAGQVGSQAVADAFDHNRGTSWLNPLTYPGKLGKGLGATSEAMGGPAWLSAGLEVAPDAATPWAAGKAMEAITASRAAQAAKPAPKAIPTTAELRKATTEAYKRGEESGVMVKAEDYAKAADEIAENAKNEAIDPVLHPKSSRIVKVLQERKGKDLDLQEAENLRRIALEAEGDINPVGAQTGDGRIAGNIVDDLDEKIDALATNAEARALNRRKSNSQMLDVLNERAEIKAGANYTQSGLENALRKEYQALALNQRRMRRLTEEQRAAIKRVAAGGKMENTLRNVGKLDPTTGGMGMAISAALAGGFAIPTSGLSLLLPALGFAGKRGATNLALRNVEKAREALVGRGLPDAAPVPASGSGAAAPARPMPAPSGAGVGGGVSRGGPVPEVLGVPDPALIEAYLAALKRRHR